MIFRTQIHDINTHYFDLMDNLYQDNIQKNRPFYIDIPTEFELFNG